MKPRKALISYSHKDEHFRSALLSALSTSIRSEEIEVWSDHQILPGSHIDDEILSQLREADVVFLLVSPDFIASDYCFTKELQIALERHANGRAVVVPIVIRPTDLVGAPFARLKMLPSDAKAVSSWGNADEAWLSVAQGVRRLIRETNPGPAEHRVSKPREITSQLRDFFDQLQERYLAQEKRAGARFGIPSLDAISDGISSGEVGLIASRPDQGHFELVMASVLGSAWRKSPIKTMVFTQRLAAPQFTNRIVCALARVSRFRMARGMLEDDDWSRVASSIRLLRETDLTIDDDPIRSVAELRRKLQSVDLQSVKLLVIDGLEYLTAGSEERQILLELSDYARSRGAAVLATVTLSPDFEQRTVRRPGLVDLGSWRAAENFCTKIILCERTSTFDFGSMQSVLLDTCKVSLVKSPDGIKESIDLRYWDDYGMVEEPITDSDQVSSAP